MLSVANILDAGCAAVAALWPGDKVYRDIVPVNFARPSSLVEVLDLTMTPEGPRSVTRTAVLQITRFQVVDDYHNTQVELLANELTLMLERFAVPALPAGDRYLDLSKITGSYANDYALIKVSLAWTDDRDTTETHQKMEHYKLAVSAGKKE